MASTPNLNNPSTPADYQALRDFADKYRSHDPADALGVGAIGYPNVGDTKVYNGDTATFDGRMWVLPSGKPAW